MSFLLSMSSSSKPNVKGFDVCMSTLRPAVDGKVSRDLANSARNLIVPNQRVKIRYLTSLPPYLSKIIYDVIGYFLACA